MEIKIKVEKIDQLIEAIALLSAAVAFKKEMPNTAKAAKELKKKDSDITFQTVRAKLAALAEAGKQAEIKALITKYGAEKLSDIPEDRYPELLKDTESV